jgi:transcriptional regulator with XRE-family HTH domain
VTLGKRIESAREMYGLSQRELGDELRVSRAAVSQYEQDTFCPRPEVMTRLASVLHCDQVWLEHGLGEGPLAPYLAGDPVLIVGARARLQGKVIEFITTQEGERLVTISVRESP